MAAERAARLRQVALVARELDPVVDDLCAVLGAQVAFRDPGVGVFGLRNAVMPLGDCFLEVVSPVRPDTTAGRLLERRGGDGGYMVIVQVAALEPARKRMERLGVRIVFDHAAEHTATLHLHPRDVGGAILSLDASDPPESWDWAGPGWREHVRPDGARGLAAVEVQGPDPAHFAARWSEVLEQPFREMDGGAFEIALDNSAVRFVPAQDGRGPGVSGVHVRVADRESALRVARERGLAELGEHCVAIGGARFTLLE